MTLKATIVVLWISTIMIPTFGTTVEWDLMHSDDAEVWDSGPIWFVGGSSKVDSSFGCNFFVTHDYVNYMAGDKIKPTYFDSIWVCQASDGDVVDHETIFQAGQKYFYSWQGDTSTFAADYSIPIDWENSVYLALATIAYNGGEEYMVYGWLELGMGDDFDPVVKSSAWDVDGGAMYVGGGAVPEPTSALLLLMGGAALLLRRRRPLGFNGV